MRDIYIVGSGPEWQKCPFDRETWIVGKMLMLKEPPKRADTIFSMDDLNYLLTIRRGMFTKDQFIEKINERSVPYYSSVVTPEIRMAREYPLKEVMSVVRVPFCTWEELIFTPTPFATCLHTQSFRKCEASACSESLKWGRTSTSKRKAQRNSGSAWHSGWGLKSTSALQAISSKALRNIRMGTSTHLMS